MLFNGQLIKDLLAKVKQLEERLNTIMSAITDWAAREEADLTAISSTLDAIATGVNELDTLIKQLQQNPGPISAEDQAILDQLEAKSAALVTKAQQINTQPPA